MDDWAPQLEPKPDNRQFKWYYHMPTSTLHMEDISGPNHKSHSTMWGEQNGPGDTPWHNLKTGYAEVWHNALGEPSIDHRWYNQNVPEHVHQIAMNALAQHLQNTPWEAAGASLTASQGKPEVASPYRLNPLNNDSHLASDFEQHDMDANEWMPERATNEFWEQRRPWMSFEDGHVWFGEPGEHHDSEPDYPSNQTDMGEITPTGEAYSYSLRNRRQRQPHIEQALQRLGSDWVSDSTDSWTGPQSVDKFHVDVPGESPGMGRTMETGAPLRSPCYCDCGATMPHEWGPTCEHGLYPTMKHEAWAPNPDHWVWLDGQVAFGGEHADIAMKLAQEQGLDHDAQRYVSNLIARGQQPHGHNVAVGTLKGGYPNIWMSTIDRNAVWDDVARATMQKTAMQEGDGPEYHYPDPEYTDDTWRFGDRTPYIYFPDSDAVYWGNPGMYHDTLTGWAGTHRNGDTDGIYGSVYRNRDNPEERFQEVHKYQWSNEWADYDPRTNRAILPDDKKAFLAERIGAPFHATKEPTPDLTDTQLDEFWKPVVGKMSYYEDMWDHEPGIWYHVTTNDRVSQIMQEGLRPDTSERRFDHEYGSGVYLWGSFSVAMNWYRAEEWGTPVVYLRVRVPDNQVQPDPEFFEDRGPEATNDSTEPGGVGIYSGVIPPNQIEVMGDTGQNSWRETQWSPLQSQ